MEKVNNFDVLKKMAAENKDIRAASTGNIREMKKVKAGTNLTFGVAGDVVGGLALGKLSAFLVIFDNEQFEQTKADLEKAIVLPERSQSADQGETPLS